MAWPWNLVYGLFKVIENGTIRKIGYSFLFTFHINYGCIISRFDIMRERDRHQAPHDGIGRAYAYHRAAKNDAIFIFAARRYA